MKKLLFLFVLLFGISSTQACCISLYDTRSRPMIGATVYNGNVIFQPFTAACAVAVQEIQMGVVVPSSQGYQVFAGIYDENQKLIKAFKNIKEDGGYIHSANANGLNLNPGNYLLGFWSNKDGPAWIKTDKGYWGSITGECVVPEPSTIVMCSIGGVILISLQYAKGKK